MANFCPEWVFQVCAAKTASDFLSSNNSLNMIAKKFASGLSVHFNEVKFEEICETAEAILGFLSEVDAGEESVNFINDYIPQNMFCCKWKSQKNQKYVLK